jgi:hypothetical protein
MRKYIYLIFILTFASCFSTRYQLRPETNIEKLSICVTYSELVTDKVKRNFDKTISDFILRYNTEQHEFKLTLCDDSTISAMKIYVRETDLVTVGDQIGSTFVFLVMIAVKLHPLLNDYNIANDLSVVDLKLTQDLTLSDTTYNRIFRSSGYLRGQEKQIRKHGIAFKDFLKRELILLEMQYKEKHQH